MPRALRPSPGLPALALALALALAPLGLRAQPRVERGPSSLVYPDFWHTPFGIHRGTPRLLDLMLSGRARFDDPAGAACATMAEDGPGGTKVTLFGVNSGAGQILYNPDMRSLAVFGERGSGDGRFSAPKGIACLPDGTVAVADTGNDRVVFLRYRAGRLRWVRALGSKGGGVGQFLAPEGVALDSQGRLFVADTGNNRVQIFDRAGVFLEAFGQDKGANNSVESPTALAVADPLEPDALRPDAALFVIDQGGRRLQKFSLDGDFLAQVTALDLGGAARFDSLALDYFGNVWVTDRGTDEIRKFDRHLQWVADWGRPGAADGCLDDPRGIAINRAYGRVVVLERESAQYLWIGADLGALRLEPEGGRIRVDYRLSERAWVDAWVEGPAGRRVATLLKRRFQRQGAQSLSWSGLGDDGGPLGPGGYTLVLRAEAAYSSATFVARESREGFTLPLDGDASSEKPQGIGIAGRRVGP